MMIYIKHSIIFILSFIIISSCINKDKGVSLIIDDDNLVEIGLPLSEKVLKSHYVKSEYTTKTVNDELLLLPNKSKYNSLRIKTIDNEIQAIHLDYNTDKELDVIVLFQKSNDSFKVINVKSNNYNRVVDNVLLSIHLCDSLVSLDILNLEQIKNIDEYSY